MVVELTSEEIEIIRDQCGFEEPDEILELTKTKVVVKAFDGEVGQTYTVEALNWGEFKSELKCDGYLCVKYFEDFEDYRIGKEKSIMNKYMW